jgi:hypothetical protein
MLESMVPFPPEFTRVESIPDEIGPSSSPYKEEAGSRGDEGLNSS